MMLGEQVDRVVNTFTTSLGAEIYQIPLEVFPGFWGFVYLVLVDGSEGGPFKVLIDSGSGFGNANEHLEAGLKDVSQLAGHTVELADLSHILITHGHIDHFGGLTYIRPRTHALLGIHELDRRILTNYEERLTIVARRLEQFFIEAGVSPERSEGLLDLYKITKGLFRSMAVDFTYESAGMKVGPFQILHVPGHCAGHVVIRLHDVLFSGDHILDDISPHQAPEHLTLSTGLEHYLRSLESMQPWAHEIRLTLGGHKQPINDLSGRLSAIKALHMTRLDQVQEFLGQPHTIKQVSQALFGEVHGYNVLLALEEAGAHVEYLYQRGLLSIENLEDYEKNHGNTPILYRRNAVHA